MEAKTITADELLDLDLDDQKEFFETFTDDQSKAFSEIVESILNGENHCLEGFAGTGKTYLCQGLQYRFPEIVFTAPTNKAVKVLEEKTGAVCTTIHKLLCLRMERGKLKQYKTPELHSVPSVVVDECSMVSEEIMGLIEMYIPKDIPIIYIGDPAQLPPVHEKLSRSFLTENKSTLNKIVRQAEGNPIIGFSKEIREKGFYVERIPNDGKNIFRSNLTKKFKFMEKAVKHDTIYCAWRNKTVTKMNFYLHNYIYGESAPDYAPGEEIVLAAPLICPLSGDILAANGDCFIVDTIEKTEHRGIESWQIRAEDLGVPIVTPTRPGAEKLQEILNEYAAETKWFEFYKLKETFADVRHTYAFTCHKLQGTTVKNVVIDVPDMMANREEADRNKLLYVALTRASDKAIFLV